MSLSRPSMAAFDEGANESFFEREKERLIQEISSVSRPAGSRVGTGDGTDFSEL